MIRLDSVKQTIDYELVVIKQSDPEHPFNLSNRKKWFNTLLIAVSSICGTFASSSVTPAYDQLHEQFNSSHEVLALALSLYVLAIGIGPLCFSPLSEYFGRRPCYLISMFLFMILNFPLAFAPNMAAIIVSRFLAGLFVGVFLTVAGGSISDMFAKEEAELPMLIFSASPFLGPSFGPFISGFIAYNTTWRWIPRVQIIWSFILCILLFFSLPETYVPRLETLKAIKLRKADKSKMYFSPLETSNKRLHHLIALQLIRPLRLMSDLSLITLNLLTALLLAIVYLFFGSFSLIFKTVYNFNIYQVGCVFLSFSVGVILSMPMLNIINQLQNYIRKEYRGIDAKETPDDHLIKAIVGTFACAIGLFWFAFTTKQSVHYIVPIIACVPFSAGMSLVFSGVFSFIVDAYKPWAASALATNAIFRCTLSAVFPLIEQYIYDRLGIMWSNALIAFLVLGLSPFPILFYVYGPQIRQRSKMMRYVWGDGKIPF